MQLPRRSSHKFFHGRWNDGFVPGKDSNYLRDKKREREGKKKKEEEEREKTSFRKNHLKHETNSIHALRRAKRERELHEIFESKTTTTVALASEKIIARNKISRVAGPFLLSALAFKCKVLFKSRARFHHPLCPLLLSLSRPFPYSLSPHPLCLSLLFPPSSPPFDSISDVLLFLAGLARSWDAPGTRGFISWYSNALKHHTRPSCAPWRRYHAAVSARISRFNPRCMAANVAASCCCYARVFLPSLFRRNLLLPSFSSVRTLQLRRRWTGSSRWKMQIANARATVMKS